MLSSSKSRVRCSRLRLPRISLRPPAHCSQVSQFPWWHLARSFKEHVRRNNEIARTEEVEDPRLIPTQFDPQFANTILKQVGVGARQLWALGLQAFQKCRYLCSLVRSTFADKTTDFTSSFLVLVVNKFPLDSLRLHTDSIHHFRCFSHGRSKQEEQAMW